MTRDAIADLQQLLTAAALEGQRSVDLVDLTAIADRAGTTRGTVASWKNRHADFPAPLRTLAIGPVWLWRDVESWLRSRPTTSASAAERQAALVADAAANGHTASPTGQRAGVPLCGVCGDVVERMAGTAAGWIHSPKTIVRKRSTATSLPPDATLLRFERQDGQRFDDRWHVLEAAGRRAFEDWTAICGKRGAVYGDTSTPEERRAIFESDGRTTNICGRCSAAYQRKGI